MANWAALQEQLMGKPVAKRAKHGIHFQNTDGSITANFSGKPCHFQDTDGLWKPIDTKLLPLGDGYYGCPHSKVKVHPDGTVAVAGTDYAQRTELPSAQTGLVDGDKLVRKFSFGEQRMWVTEDGFRSEIQLNRIPTLTEARKLIATESGTLSKGYLKSLTTATDANGNEHTFSTLAAFRTWLAQAQFPVVIDPDFEATTTFGYIYGANEDFSIARSTSSARDSGFTVGVWQALTYIWRSYLKFDTSSIDDGQAISQVNIKLTVKSNTSTTHDDILIAKFNWVDSWGTGTNREDDYDGLLAADLDDSIWRNTNGANNNSSYTSGNLSTAWVNKTGITSYGFIAKQDKNDLGWLTKLYCQFYTPTDTTESYRPVLTVTYTAGGALLPVNMHGQMQSLTGGMRG